MIRIRPEVAGLSAYEAGRSGAPDDERFAGVVLLASNELAFGPLPSVVEAISRAARSINRYPDPLATHVRAAVAALHGASVDEVAVGAGSVEVFRQALFAVVGSGDEVVIAEPTFPEYAAATALVGATSVRVPLAESVHDLAAMARALSERTRAVVICNPNNPTSTALDSGTIERFVAELASEVLVVVDEAYAEFADRSCVNGFDLVRAHDNVVVLRTFSKAYGLASLRVGYALASAEMVGALGLTRLPFGVSSLAQVAAVASLAAGDELAERVRQVKAERQRVVEALAGLGIDVPAPQGNFCFLPLGDRAAAAARHLAARGVLVRPLAGALRVTIGLAEENDRLLEVLSSIAPGDDALGNDAVASS